MPAILAVNFITSLRSQRRAETGAEDALTQPTLAGSLSTLSASSATTC